MFNPVLLSRASGGTGPAGPSYIRPVLRRVESDFFPNTTWDEIFSSTSKTKADLVAIAQAGAPGIPTNAFGLEYFIIAPGGPGFSGSGFGGLPGATARGIIPFDLIPDGGSVNFEIGAPGVGQADGQGSLGGMSTIVFSDGTNLIFAECGRPGEQSQEAQRANNAWTTVNGIMISDLGQDIWTGMYASGPNSSNSPGGGAPTAYDTVKYPVIAEGGLGAFPITDFMYMCGNGGASGSVQNDTPGFSGATPGGGGGASGPSHPGGSGGAAVTRYAIVFWEPVNG